MNKHQFYPTGTRLKYECVIIVMNRLGYSLSSVTPSSNNSTLPKLPSLPYKLFVVALDP